ncbi:hypothetical protein [Microbispora rosea]|uniref:hypothetical protein n=1 Tax=Microbispora rosea TaxID=58117 RepID=UPI000AB10178|nr:hypothetical protein [Microbispora rosea]
MDLDDIAARLGVPVEDVDRVHRLAGDRPSAPLPAKADAPSILDPAPGGGLARSRLSAVDS